MIWHNFNTIFIHITKTAGTTVEEMFRDNGDVYNVHEKHVTAHDMQQRYPKEWEKYFTFSIVRNPWDRAYSLWFNLKKDGRLKGELVDSIHSWKRFDRITMSQFDFLSNNDQIIVDQVWQYEDLNQTIQAIRDRFCLTGDVPHGKFIPNKPKYRTYYEEHPEAIDKVAKVYSKDVEAFGYDFC